MTNNIYLSNAFGLAELCKRDRGMDSVSHIHEEKKYRK